MKTRAMSSGPGIIDVWTWSLDRPTAEVVGLASLLSPDEADRASRFVNARDANRYVVARANMRIILGGRLGTPPRELTFAYNDFGKPRLMAKGVAPPHFNLSHSGALAMLAISDSSPLGIDIEEMKPVEEDVAGYFFSARERASLKRLLPSEYLRAFYRCWTRKEALVKARGEGLTIALDSFDVSVGGRATLDLSRLEDETTGHGRWKLCNLEVPPGFQGAVAVLTDGVPVPLRYHGDPRVDVVRASLRSSAAHPERSGLRSHRNDDSRSASA